MIFSTDGVQTPASKAIFALTPSANNVSRHNLAIAIAARVVFPPAQEIASLRWQALAS